MPTYKLIIEYDGSAFGGWQFQPNAITVQQTIEDALQIAARERISIMGSGRTDAGVHARGQVAHFRTEQTLDIGKLLYSLNALMPQSVVIRRIETTHDDFHARFDAKERRYHYYISFEPFALERNARYLVRPAANIEAMNEAAAFLIGKHHFGSFCLAHSETQNRICTLYKAQWIQEANPLHWHFQIYGTRFLHGMVRAIVGTLIEIGHGKREVQDMTRILAAQHRGAAGFAAPPHGLVLEQVLYNG